MTKRIFLNVLPFLISIVMGIVLMMISFYVSGTDFHNILVSMASTFFAIPLIFIFYELIKGFSDRKLNVSTYNYAKWKVDKELLSILAHLTKRVCQIDRSSLQERSLGFYDNLEELISKVGQREFFGFQIFKKMDFNENSLNRVLENPFFLSRMKNKEIITLISIIKDISEISNILRKDDLFTPTNKQTNSFKIVHGGDINTENKKIFPDRYLILKKINKTKSFVFDFGDYNLYDREKLSKSFIINRDYLVDYCKAIFILLRDIEKWYLLTGKKMMIDPKDFKLSQDKLNKTTSP